jgi:flavin reductase (DIM6/NTAB) family NADH-FMN oxidoreductase RutF
MEDRTTEPSLREVMSRYPTGVTVVGGRDEFGTPYGITVNSFTSVSLDPPLVLVCVGHRSTWHDRLVSAEGFAVSVLASGQGAIALRFAKEPSDGRFDEIAWSRSPSGDPVVDGAVAWLDCTRFDVLDGGDHSILVGRVEASGASDRAALVFHRGRLISTAE